VEEVFEVLGQIVLLDLNTRKTPRILYSALREKYRRPMIMKASLTLFNAIKENKTVFISTGFIMPKVYAQETDGPLGAVVLARALTNLGIDTILLTEPQNTELLKELLLTVDTSGRYKVLEFPTDPNEANIRAEELLKSYNPSALIFIEKVGANYKGEYHTMGGINVTGLHAKVDILAKKALAEKKTVIGIGDGGNEVGMGVLEEIIREKVPYGRVCRCPCKGGIACHTSCTALVVSTTSNWGAYALVSGLSLLSHSLLLHTPLQEEELLKKAVELGCVDGVLLKKSLSVDSIPLKENSAVVELLNSFTQRNISD